MSKKNLDDLFREKFETFRETPDAKVWTAIEKSLDKKRKKRVIPLWWQLGGAAAVLAIALIALFQFSGDAVSDSEMDGPITDTERTEGDTFDGKSNTKESFDTDILEKDIDQAVTDTGTSDAESQERESSNGQIEGESLDRAVADTENGEAENKDKRDSDSQTGGESLDRAVADTENGDAESREKESSDSRIGDKSLNRAVADTDDGDAESIDKNVGAPTNAKNVEQSPDHEETKVATARITEQNPQGEKDAKQDVFPANKSNNDAVVTRSDTDNGAIAISNEEEIGTNNSQTKVTKIPDEPKTKSVGEAIAASEKERPKSQKLPRALKNKGREEIATAEAEVSEKEQRATQDPYDDTRDNNQEAIAKTDTTPSEENQKSILEALEPEEDMVAETSKSRWSAGPSIAPVYFNALGDGSPIDPSFTPNSKSGNTNMSYGLTVAYAVTDKLKVRSGLHRSEYGYDTNNVDFSPTLAASTSGRLRNIGPDRSLSSFDASEAPVQNESLNSAPEFTLSNTSRDGTVAQSFGYLEVPLELDYALVNNRFGVNLIGGISSLVLIDNSVTLSSEELSTGIGEANNLNNLNFSTNVGFGINYKFTPKIQFNLEPVFKYQLNTFSNVSGDFRPYTIGVYSGLNFRF